MSQPEFDRFASSYRQIHKVNISVSGEPPEYFAEYKMRDFAALVDAAGVDRSGAFLDFGSGVGSSIRPFRQRFPLARLVCADVSLESLKASHAAHGDGPTYLPLLNGSLALDDRTMNGAFACCVFHHIPEAEHAKVLSDLRRVLKPGALLMIYEHNPFNPLTLRAVNTCPLDENAVLITAQEMRRRCVAANFAEVRVDYRVFFPAPMRALRIAEDWLRWLPLGAQYCLTARA